MYFTIIPFFLVANVAIRDPNEWIHGPEYVFRVEGSYAVILNQSEPLFLHRENWTMRCRPKEDAYLLCQFGNKDFDVLNEVSSERTEIEYPFLIEFNPRGIESIRLPESIAKYKMNRIRSTVKELSVGTDMREYVERPLPFYAKENSVLGECRTLFNISVASESEEDVSSSEKEEDRDYDLSIVSLPPLPPDLIAVIEKRTEEKRCANIFPREGDFEVKIMSYSSKKYIGKNVFKSSNEIRFKVKNHDDNQINTSIALMTVELTGIRPAKEPVPALSFNQIEKITYATTNNYYK